MALFLNINVTQLINFLSCMPGLTTFDLVACLKEFEMNGFLPLTKVATTDLQDVSFDW